MKKKLRKHSASFLFRLAHFCRGNPCKFCGEQAGKFLYGWYVGRNWMCKACYDKIKRKELEQWKIDKSEETKGE